MDIKITNCCDMGCPMCHENSTPDGKHADILGPSFLDKLHPYTELAIGGGNPLEHPDLYEFLVKCRERKFIPSMTINQKHFEANYDLVKKALIIAHREDLIGNGPKCLIPSVKPRKFIPKHK